MAPAVSQSGFDPLHGAGTLARDFSGVSDALASF
jgi:hypothetical protein